MKRFRGGLVVKAHRLVYHSTVGLRVIKKKEVCGLWFVVWGLGFTRDHLYLGWGLGFGFGGLGIRV